MEDEFTRRLNLMIGETEEESKQFLIDRDSSNYHICLGKLFGLNYAKETYIAFNKKDIKQ